MFKVNNNFENILHRGSIVNFEQVNTGWDKAYICNFADDRSLYSIEDNFKS